MKLKNSSLFQKTARIMLSYSLANLVSIFGSYLPVESMPASKSPRHRVFSYVRTFWLFLYQVLQGNLSLNEMVQHARVWLLATDNVSISPNTSAFSQARKRLPIQLLREVFDCVANQISSRELFYGYKVKLVDGTGISMPDTQENRDCYPEHPKSGKHSGFPGLKLVCLFDYIGGCVLDWATETITTSDSRLFMLFWPHLQPNDLIVGDRHFCGYANFAFLRNLGIHMMTRKHQMRKHQKTVKRLGRKDLIVEWAKPKSPPKWENKEEWAKYPDNIKIREIAYSVRHKGFRTRSVTITTTVLDETIPAEKWAELYFHRWDAEVFLRDIKITLGMDMLKGQTPDMISKEVNLYFIAYNLIRLLMYKAAEETGAQLQKISFKSTVTAIRIWVPILAEARTKAEYNKYLVEFLREIAYPRCRNRKHKSEPRAKKRRAKNYQLLTGDRHHFVPIAHRNKYKKTARSKTGGSL